MGIDINSSILFTPPGRRSAKKSIIELTKLEICDGYLKKTKCTHPPRINTFVEEDVGGGVDNIIRVFD